MAIPQPYIEKESYTEDEYLAFERDHFGRWEFVNGEIRAMSGGTDDHNTIAVNIGATLHSPLASRGCRVYVADMKVHTGNGINTFPDVAVVCGPRQYHRGRVDIITNPVLLVEVLSESTQDYDRGTKFDHYKTIPTLIDYLLVVPDEARVLLYTRHEDHWDFREVHGLQNAIRLPSVETTLRLAEIYAQIELADKSATPQLPG
jgi:Uma2 family endonuclease